jgi:hypothetical protein
MSVRKKIILLPMLILAAWLFLAGCSVDQSPYATPLDSPMETSTPDPAQLYAQAGFSQSTAQAAASTAQFFGNQLTATFQQHNWDATATWSAANMTATQQSWNASATAESNQATSTAAAESDQATSTAAAQMAANATMAAATQVAFDVTATVAYADARTYATAMAGQAVSVDLGVRRDIMTNNVRAAAPWVVSALVLGLALFVAWRTSRVRIIRTGQFGDKPLLLDLKDGVVTDPDLSIHPQTGTRLADVKRLSSPSAEVQAQAKMRDQMIDLGTRGTSPNNQDSQQSPRRRAAAGLMNAAAALPIQTHVTLLPSDQAAGMVQDVIPAIVRDATGVDIDEEVKK